MRTLHRWIVAAALVAGCGKREDAVSPAAPIPAPTTAPAPAPAPTPTPAPAPAAVVVLPRSFHRIAGVLGAAVAIPGETKTPACCLDCEPLVPELQQLARLAAALDGPVGATELRAAARRVRDTPWDRLLAGTAYHERSKQDVVRTVRDLAARLDATAAALETGERAAAAAEQVGAAVDKLMTAADALGAQSKQYCIGD